MFLIIAELTLVRVKVPSTLIMFSVLVLSWSLLSAPTEALGHTTADTERMPASLAQVSCVLVIISGSLQYYLSQAVTWFYELYFILQMQRSQSIQSDWWAGLVAMKVVWRLSLLDSGALSVMMLGGATMEM